MGNNAEKFNQCVKSKIEDATGLKAELARDFMGIHLEVNLPVTLKNILTLTPSVNGRVDIDNGSNNDSIESLKVTTSTGGFLARPTITSEYTSEKNLGSHWLRAGSVDDGRAKLLQDKIERSVVACAPLMP